MLDGEHKKKYRIHLFCGITLLFWFSLYTYVPILTTYVTEMGADHKTAGIIVGSYGFVQMLLRIPTGILSDRLHKRRLFINFGLVFSILSAFGLWISKDLTTILIFRALAGAAAATWVDFTVLYASYYPHNRSTEAIGTLSFYNSMGQMLAMLIGGYAAEKAGYVSTFGIGWVVGIIALILSFFIVENNMENPGKISIKQVLRVAGDKTLLAVSLLAILSQTLTFATVFGFTPLFAQEMGATKFEMSLLTVFSSLPGAFASIIGGKHLSARYGEKRVVIWGFILSGAFTVVIPFCPSLGMLMLTQVFAGIGRGLSFPALMSLSIKHMETEKRATAMGFFQAIYGLGMFSGPVIMGLIGDYMSLSQGFIVLGVVGCITAFLSYLFIKGQGPVTAN